MRSHPAPMRFHGGVKCCCRRRARGSGERPRSRKIIRAVRLSTRLISPSAVAGFAFTPRNVGKIPPKSSHLNYDSALLWHIDNNERASVNTCGPKGSYGTGNQRNSSSRGRKLSHAAHRLSHIVNGALSGFRYWRVRELRPGSLRAKTRYRGDRR